MRTKTLLLTAVLSAAGAASSFAQAVYSQNAVGYVNVSLDPGFNLICNPLKNTAGNQLSKILTLTDADIGTTVYWYNTTTKGFKNSTFLGAAVGWTPDQAIDPGVGIFINVSAAKTVTFVGDVPQGTDSNISLSSGFSLISSPVPQSADLAAMQFPARCLDLSRSGGMASGRRALSRRRILVIQGRCRDLDSQLFGKYSVIKQNSAV